MNWSIFVGVLIGAIIALGLAYLIASFVVGQEVAQRNLQGIFPIGILAGVSIPFLFYFLSNIEYLWFTLAVLALIFVLGSIVNWFWRKRQTGLLLLNVGQTRSHRLTLGAGVIFTLLAMGQTYILITRTTETFAEDNNLLLSQIVFNWALAIFFIVNGLSKLELREKAICFMSAILKWDEIKSYKWEGKQGNILTTWHKKQFLGFPNHQTFPIPAHKKAAVESILNEYLS